MQASRLMPLSARELAAWRGFLRAHASLVRQLDHELEQAHDLPLHEYEVLLLLAGAPDGRLRMSELAEGALLSQSGLTRLVDRLVRRGLVVRERCEQDRRGLYARISDEGLERFAEARATHLAGVRTRFLDRPSPEELEALAETWDKVLPDAAGGSC